MKIMIISNDGEVLDSAEISREEWDNLTPTGAFALIDGLQVGSAS